MEKVDISPIVHVVSKTSAAAKEAAKLTQDILYTIKLGNPTLEKIRKDLSCFAEACDLLLLQLGEVGGLEGLAAEDVSDKYWFCVSEVCMLWLKNVEDSVQRLRKDQRLRAGRIGRILPSHMVTRYGIRLWYVEAIAGGHLQDAQLVTALLNLQLALRDSSGLDKDHHLEFFCKDLVWRARTVHDRVCRTRQQLELHPNWSRAQSFIAEIAVDTATHATKRTIPAKESLSIDDGHSIEG